MLFVSWLVGLAMTHTELGQRVLAWERAVFAKHSKVLTKQAAAEAKVTDEAAKARARTAKRFG